jgi:hypothetical protein
MPPRRCPFCDIAATHPPTPTSAYLPRPDQESQPTIPPSTSTLSPGEEGHAFLVLSTKYVLAFLDIMPLTAGHLLVVPREHHGKLSEVGVRISREVGAIIQLTNLCMYRLSIQDINRVAQLGQWLPILSRAVMRTIFGESTEANPNTDESWNWNVVQNNGILPIAFIPSYLIYLRSHNLYGVESNVILQAWAPHKSSHTCTSTSCLDRPSVRRVHLRR